MLLKKNTAGVIVFVLLTLSIFAIYAEDKTVDKRISVQEYVKKYFSPDSKLKIDKEMIKLSGTAIANESSIYISENWPAISKTVNDKIYGLTNVDPKLFLPLAITWAKLIKGNDDDPYRYMEKAVACIFSNSDQISLKRDEPELIKLFSNRAKNKDISLKELIMWSFLDNGNNMEEIRKIVLSTLPEGFTFPDGGGYLIFEIRIATDLILGNLGDEISANKIISILKDDRKEQSLPTRIFLCSSALFVKNNNILKHYSFLLDDETPAIPAAPSGTNIYQRICDYSIIQLAKKFNIDPKEFLMTENKDRWRSLYIFQQEELKIARQLISKKLNEINRDKPEDKDKKDESDHKDSPDKPGKDDTDHSGDKPSGQGKPQDKK